MQFHTILTLLLGLGGLILASPTQLIAKEDLKYGLPGVELTPNMVAELKAMSATLSGSTLEERNKSDILCSNLIGAYGWPWALTKDIEKTIQMVLDGKPSECLIGYRKCFAIQCWNRDCIVVCNDNEYNIKPTCTYLASYAAEIIDLCNKQLHWGGKHVIGQRFDTDRYNVIVRGFD